MKPAISLGTTYDSTTHAVGGDTVGVILRNGKGYILVSDQQANKFHIFAREGVSSNPHQHDLIKAVKVSTIESDGSEITNVSLNSQFPNGLFVAMSDNKTFQYYRPEDLLDSLILR